MVSALGWLVWRTKRKGDVVLSVAVRDADRQEQTRSRAVSVQVLPVCSWLVVRAMFDVADAGLRVARRHRPAQASWAHLDMSGEKNTSAHAKQSPCPRFVQYACRYQARARR